MINPSQVVASVRNASENLETACKTLDILEGCLEKYVIKSLERQLSPKVMRYAKERVVPINILPRYVDKLTNIYQTGVLRDVKDGVDEDDSLVSWYSDKFKINKIMHHGNRLFNACKSCLVHPYMTDKGPSLRVIPNDSFVVYSEDPINPM